MSKRTAFVLCDSVENHGHAWSVVRLNLIATLLYSLLMQCCAQGMSESLRITFDGPPTQPPRSDYFVTQYQEAGMVFAGGFGRAGGGRAALPENGSAYLDGGPYTLVFWSASGAVFDLVAVDVAEGSTVVADARAVQFLGYRPDGSSVSTVFTTDGIIDGTGPLEDFETFTFPRQFRGLERVEVPAGVWSLDNLQVIVRAPPYRRPVLHPVAWGLFRRSGLTLVRADLTNVVAGAAGGDSDHGFSVVALAEGSVRAWGDVFYRHTNVPAGLSNVVAVAADDTHVLALLEDGTVRTWGGDQGVARKEMSDVVGVAAGAGWNIALRADGSVVGWAPTSGAVRMAEQDVVAIAASGTNRLALKADGTVLPFGSDLNGLREVPAEATNVVAIACGDAHSLALRADGTVVAWGDNSFHQTTVPLTLANVAGVAAGGDTSFALRGDGTVVAWGRNTEGQTDLPEGLANVWEIAVGTGHAFALVGEVPPQLYPPVSDAQWSDGRFSVTVPAESGHVYRLEYRASLTEEEWTPLPLVAGRPGELVLRDDTAGGAQRFYRVRRW